MRVRRSTFLISTMVAAMLSLAGAGAALADAGSGATSATGSSSSSSTSTTTTVVTSSKTPTDTSTKPPTDTKAPVTEVPKTPTPKPVTEAPKTPAPTCADTSSCVTTPENQELPKEPTCADTPDAAGCNKSTCADTPTAADCIQDQPTNRTIPDAPGGGDLPFTGPGDVVLAIVLALLAGTGGILFLFGASGREQLDTLNRRGMDSPSGFHLAYRELRKDQLDR